MTTHSMMIVVAYIQPFQLEPLADALRALQLDAADPAREIAQTDDGEAERQDQLADPGRHRGEGHCPARVLGDDQPPRVPGEQAADDRGAEVGERPGLATRACRQQPRQDVDRDVPVGARRGHRPRHPDPQHQHAQERIRPDQPHVEHVAQQDLAAGQQDHRGQQEHQRRVLDARQQAGQAAGGHASGPGRRRCVGAGSAAFLPRTRPGRRAGPLPTRRHAPTGVDRRGTRW